MNFIETLMSEKLKDKNPMLDVIGSDHKVLQIACQDLVNYLEVHWDVTENETGEFELVERLEKFFHEYPAELNEFLNMWTGMWLRKWNERVKLLIGGENSKRWSKVTKMLTTAEPIWRKLSNRQEMQRLITSTLVKNGEICGTSILAENLLKMELGDVKKRQYRNEQEQVLNVVNDTLRKAKELAQSKGPFIFVKIDKGYYGAH